MEKCVDNILQWYQEHRLELPWRKDKNPYHVWISEIMLQQTRIEAVVAYYERFMKALPTVFELAAVDEDVLLKLWEGLGYYNRARNLKAAAVMIVNEYEGIFPSTYQELLLLPGVGSYTASAIASICFQEPQVTVDGNVMRVYTRFYNDFSNISKESTKKMIQTELLAIVPAQSGNFNEGLMEIGEQVCIPNGIPKCGLCPLQTYCLAYQNGNYYKFPVRDEKKKKEVVALSVMIFIWKGKIFVQKRKKLGLLHNLYEFPNLEGRVTKADILVEAKNYGIVSDIQKGISYTHVFTHKKWEMGSFFIFMDEVVCPNLFVEVEKVERSMAIPTAFYPFLVSLKEIIL